MDLTSIWETAGTEIKADRPSFEPLAKGEYVAVVDEAGIELKSQTEGRANFKFKVVDGEHKNRVLFRNIPLNAEDAAHWGLKALRKDFEALGIDLTPKKLEDFGPALYKLMGKKLKVYVTQSKPDAQTGKIYNRTYINGYFNAAEAIEGAGTGNAPPSMNTDEELPF
jgi:hypothetical protein